MQIKQPSHHYQSFFGEDPLFRPDTVGTEKSVSIGSKSIYFFVAERNDRYQRFISKPNHFEQICYNKIPLNIKRMKGV